MRYYVLVKLRSPVPGMFYGPLHVIYDSLDVRRCHMFIRIYYRNVAVTADASYETENGNVVMVMNENTFNEYNRISDIANTL
jgi:hypothetical protein